MRPLIETTAAPSNIAVGEGAVWALDSEAENGDPDRSRDEGRQAIRAGPRPTDLAVGGGAVWVGNGRWDNGVHITTDIPRVDPLRSRSRPP